MNVLYILVPIALILAGLFVWGFSWAARRGQFDDVQTPALRMLQDDEESVESVSVGPTHEGQELHQGGHSEDGDNPNDDQEPAHETRRS